SDQYALAVMVYEWLSGEVPFSGAPIEVALQHLNDPPPALSAVDIPPAVEEVVLKALAKDPPARFASVQAFADALEAAAQGDAIHPGVLDAHIAVSSPQGTNKQAKAGQEERESVAAARRPALLLAEREGRPRGPVGEFFWSRGSSSHGRILFLASLALIVVIASFGVVLLVQPNPFSLTHSSPTPVSNVSTTIPQSFPTPTSIPTKVPPTSVPTLAPTSKPLAPPAPPTLLLTVPSAVVGVAWSPGGRFYAAADVSGDVGVWQTPNKQQWEVNLGTKIWSLAWSPDSPQAQRLAVAGDDGKVRIFDALSGKQLMLYGGHGAVSVLSVAWSKPYNATAVSVVSGDANGVIHVWDPATGNTLVTMNQTAPVDGLASAYSSLISAGAPPGGNVYMWDTGSGQGSEQFNNSNSNIPYGADNPNLVEGTIVSAAWSADATYMALGDTNGNIQLISDTNCSCWMFQTAFLAHKGRVNSISWSSNNTTFATASDDGAIKTWRGADGSLVQTYRNPYNAKDSAVAWSPDGQTLLAGDSMGRIMLWQVA
ncbi:MAG TPA: hypothetical protein VGT44_16460, partial [Ktedonobacteraceae bacterium]|nr:hypothetical protein [Ktedonobacteraceae bacterium]